MVAWNSSGMYIPHHCQIRSVRDGRGVGDRVRPDEAVLCNSYPVRGRLRPLVRKLGL